MTQVHNTINIINSNNNSQNVLKDGNSVFVRILNTTENSNKYIASFAGTVFEVTSKEKLLPGSEFRAKIKIQNGTLQLIATKKEVNKAENTTSKFDLKTFSQENKILTEFLRNLNLPQDKISLNLIQFFQQHQIKLNIPQIKKSRNKIKNILDKKEQNINTENLEEEICNLSQLDINFELKGFSLTDDNLEKLYKQLKFNNSESDTTETNNSENNENDNLLTLINHVKIKNSKFHWIISPFEMKIKENLHFGNIRFLINLEEKKLQKICIFCTNSKIKHYFMIYYNYQEQKLKKSIKYFCEPFSNKDDIQLLNDIFSDTDNIESIEFSSEAKMQGLFTEDIPITMAEYKA